MKVVELPLEQLQVAEWNPNQLDERGQERLRASLTRYGLVQALVVRPLRDGRYEVLGGNQRLRALRESGANAAPCVVVELDDAQAKLLSQALNHIHGEDDQGLRGELLREVLEDIPAEEVLALLPDSAEGLHALVSLGEADLAQHLQAWQDTQGARLHHLQLQLTGKQLPLVERALRKALPQAKEARGDNPNLRGSALTVICRHYLACRRGRP